MNAERLHAVTIALNQEMTKSGVTEKLQALIQSLTNVINQPIHPHQQNLANTLNAVYAAIKESPSDSFSPAWRQILVEMGGDDICGETLKNTIEGIFARNQITPAVAMQELQELHKRIKDFKSALEQCTTAFRQFNIGDEKLSPGDCEIGVLIPRKSIDNRLIEFSDELKEIGFILNTFSEVATGKKDELAIRTISSSDLLVHLSATAPYAACVAIAIERIVTLYKQLLEIRKLRQELQKQGVPDERITGIQDYANHLMGEGIENVTIEIINQFYKEKDKGRKNELTNAVRISLKKLANRIDKGFNVEVRVEPLDKVEPESEENIKIREATNIIQTATKNMQFLKAEGSPILKLPESK